MAYTYEELKGKTLAELRDIAQTVEEHDAVQGFSQMNKDHLLPAICKALGIDTLVHHHAVGIDKATLKAQIKALKVQRDHALASHDHGALKSVRRHIHRINRDIRKHLA